MYYEEKVIDGVLYFRGTPTGEWERATSARADALLLMRKLRKESPEHFDWVMEELKKMENELVPLKIFPEVNPEAKEFADKFLESIGIEPVKPFEELSIGAVTPSTRKAGW